MYCLDCLSETQKGEISVEIFGEENPRQYEEVGGEEIHRQRTRGGVGFQCSMPEPEPDDNII